MKINLYSNTSINVENLKSFTGIDVLGGVFAYYPENSSFGRKFLNLIDSFMSKVAPISKLDQTIADTVDSAIDYLNSQTSVGFSPFLKVYLKFDSLGAAAVQSLPILNDPFGPDSTNIIDFHINFGTNLFKDPDNAISLITKKYGVQKTVEQTIFHEISHSLERYNYQFNPFFKATFSQNSPESLYQELASKLNLYSGIDHNAPTNSDIEAQNKSSQVHYVLPNMGLINDLRILHGEIYSDVSAILLVRNKEIKDGTHDPVKFTQYIQDICEYRNIEHSLVNEKAKTNQGLDYVATYKSISHLSTPGITDTLNELLSPLDKTTQLTGPDMHNISLNACRTGISRTILTILKCHPHFAAQFDTIFSTKINELTKKVSFEDNPAKCLEFMSKLKTLASPSWLQNFEDNVNLIESQNVPFIAKEGLIFEAGIKPSFFLNSMKKYTNNNLVNRGENNNPTGATHSESLLTTSEELSRKVKNKCHYSTQELLHNPKI